jgi:hypothetical protein
MKEKFFADHRDAARKLFQDVGSNNVKVYDVSDYERLAQIPVHPQSVTQKFTHVTVAASGEAVTGRDWMIVAPYRLDESKSTKEKCYDIDPVLFVLDSTDNTPHPSGVVAYHQDFDRRTTPAPGYGSYPMQDAVSEIRSKVVSGLQPLEQAEPEVLNSLQHMVRKFRSDFTQGDE